MNFSLNEINLSDKINKIKYYILPKLNKLKNQNILTDKKQNILIKFLFFIIFILINIYYIDLNLIIFIKFNFLLNEVQKLNKFLKICEKGILMNKNKFEKKNNPKISVISTCHNKEKYILRLIRSIQNQFFDDIEIILIDDHSIDNTTKLIEKYKIEDERIILIKHNKNKGTFISRNVGVLKSKGEFIIIPDGDDIFSYGIFNLLYKTAKEKNTDIIKYNVCFGQNNCNNYAQYYPKTTVNQPDLFNLIYFGDDNNKWLDLNLWNKFIKREVYIKCLNLIDKKYLNENMIYYEDALINYIIYKQSRKFYFFDVLGYLYLDNPNSMMHSYGNNANKSVRSFFIYLKFIFQYSSNIKKEDEIINFNLKRVYDELKYNDLYKNINKYFDFYYEVINLYLNSIKISFDNKKITLKIKKIIKKVEKKIKKNKKNFNNNLQKKCF